MKHLKIFEEISTSISPDLLGLDGKLLTKELALNLIEKYFREKDSQRYNHLMGLIRGTQPQLFKNNDFSRAFIDLCTKYNIEENDPNFIIDLDKRLPGEYDAVEKDSMRAQKYNSKSSTLKFFEAELEENLHDVVNKLKDTGRYPFLFDGSDNRTLRTYLLKAGADAVNYFKSRI